jgi:FAD reductase [NAD(P)H]
MKMLGLSGAMTPRSKPLILVEEVLRASKEKYPDMETDLLDLHKLNVEFCDGRQADKYGEDTRKAINMMSSSDIFVIGTPIYHASMTGALKNLLDLVSAQTFNGKIVGFVVAGGSYQHYLVVENQLKPIFGYLESYVAPKFIFGHDSQFDKEKNIIDDELYGRIDNLAELLIDMHLGFRSMKGGMV